MAQQGPVPAWHAAFPNPRNTLPDSITRAELLSKIHRGYETGVDFLLIDLRRTDFEVYYAPMHQFQTYTDALNACRSSQGGTIRGSLNIPAQTLYHSLHTVLKLCVAPGVKSVIFYCSERLSTVFPLRSVLIQPTDSSRGRGTRAAGWFDDLIQDEGVTSLRSLILLEGIEGWANAGPEYVKLMDGYGSKAWDTSS